MKKREKSLNTQKNNMEKTVQEKGEIAIVDGSIALQYLEPGASTEEMPNGPGNSGSILSTHRQPCLHSARSIGREEKG